MNKNYIILLLSILLIFSLINNYIMYKKCYHPYSANIILDKIPNDVSYTNYIVFYKNDGKKHISDSYDDMYSSNNAKNLEMNMQQFSDDNLGKYIIYSSYDKQINLTNGTVYDIKSNLL